LPRLAVSRRGSATIVMLEPSNIHINIIILANMVYVIFSFAASVMAMRIGSGTMHHGPITT
jgi:hypothetical protein